MFILVPKKILNLELVLQALNVQTFPPMVLIQKRNNLAFHKRVFIDHYPFSFATLVLFNLLAFRMNFGLKLFQVVSFQFMLLIIDFFSWPTELCRAIYKQGQKISTSSFNILELNIYYQKLMR